MQHAEVFGAQIHGGRERQEDAFAWLCAKNGAAVGVVADGLGGHVNGDVASRLAVAHACLCLAGWQALHVPPSIALPMAQTAALEAIEAASAAVPCPAKNMASTLAMLYVDRHQHQWLSVGDSLVFRLRGDDFTQLNATHAAEDGSLSSALGHGVFTGYDMPPEPLPNRKGDRFLLATDGILAHNHWKTGETLAAAKTPREAVESLLANAAQKNKYKQDNLTLVAIFPRVRDI